MTSCTSTETVIALGRAASTWTACCDYDVALLARIGLACPNLQTISGLTTHYIYSFSAASFGRLFALPKPRPKYLDVTTTYNASCTRSESDMPVVLSVLAEKIISSESFTPTGTKLPLEPLRRFLRSQKELKQIDLRCCGCGACNSQWIRRKKAFVELKSKWIPIIAACIESRSLEEVKGKGEGI